MKQVVVLAFIPLLFFVIGCGETTTSGRDTGTLEFATNQDVDFNKPNQPVVSSKSSSKTHNGITYSFNMMSAIDFLTKKGEQVAKNDRDELSKETVVIVTFNSSNKNKNIFELEQMAFDKEVATQYLIDAFGKDVTIEQGGKTFSPTGVHYETGIGEIGQLRAFLYFEGINISNPAKVIYYDRLFGAGLLRFAIKN